MLIRTFYSCRPFGKLFRGPGLSSAPPLLPSRHNHTCLILSNLSFILANQLLRCALFHHLLSCDSIIFSLTPLPTPLPLHPPPPTLTLYSLSFSPLSSCSASPFPPVMASGSTLTRPSARAQTNQSRVVLFHKDQKQLVSSHVSRFFLVCLCCPICLTGHTKMTFKSMNACLDFFIPLSINYCLSA